MEEGLVEGEDVLREVVDACWDDCGFNAFVQFKIVLMQVYYN